jgi:hypothetical protein
MEFDIGTLIYIIITIVAIVAGVAGKKKNPAPGTGSSGEGGSKSFFDKLEEQLSGFADEAKGAAGSIPEEVRAPFAEDQPVMSQRIERDDDRIQAQHYLEEDEESAFNEYEGIYDPEQQENLEQMSAEALRTTDESDMLQVVEMDEPDHPDYYEIVSEFDLGTAVIYSSIINRKEY